MYTRDSMFDALRNALRSLLVDTDELFEMASDQRASDGWSELAESAYPGIQNARVLLAKADALAIENGA